MTNLTLPIIAEALFSAQMGDRADEVRAALQTFSSNSSTRSIPGCLIPGWLPTLGHWRARQAIQRLDSIIYRLIHERRSRNAEGSDLLSMLLRAQDDAGHQLTDRELRDEVMTVSWPGTKRRL